MEKISQTLNSLIKIEGMLEILIAFWTEAKNVFGPWFWNIYMIEPSLFIYIADKMHTSKARFVTKVIVDSISYHVVSNSQSKIHASFNDIDIGNAKTDL